MWCGRVPLGGLQSRMRAELTPTFGWPRERLVCSEWLEEMLALICQRRGRGG